MFVQTEISRLEIGSGADQLMCLDASAPGALDAYAGQAQAVYIDPPFQTGEEFAYKRPCGEAGWRGGRPTVRCGGFSDRFDQPEAYDALLRGLIRNAHGLLREEGLFALHLDWRASARARLIGEEIFGAEQFVNEIIWSYESGGRARRWFSRKHDTILLFAKDAKKARFRIERVPIPRTGRRNHLRRGQDADGRTWGAVTVGGKEYRYYDDDPAYPGDVWADIGHLQQRDPERTGWPTQKPLRLVERLLLPTVEAGDLAADLCCGSGTALEAARQLGCRFVGCDSAPEAIAVAAHRLRENLSVTCPAGGSAALWGDVRGGLVMLTGLEAPHPGYPADIAGLEAMESWTCGRLTPDGVLRAEGLLRRTRKSPALPPMAPLPGGAGDPAVACFDAAGRLFVFRWSEE